MTWNTRTLISENVCLLSSHTIWVLAHTRPLALLLCLGSSPLEPPALYYVKHSPYETCTIMIVHSSTSHCIKLCDIKNIYSGHILPMENIFDNMKLFSLHNFLGWKLSSVGDRSRFFHSAEQEKTRN